MTNEEFLRKCDEPVDIEKVERAIENLIHGKPRFSIPVQPDDDDVLVNRALQELKRLKSKVK
ncbi:hypothetical protein G7L40_00390 [Paenibacillus polymyxa]|uniref:Uncharacterized protein n=1 Tax=Paenibacillus polymyxa TaxID=1406 RepID=A0A378XV78_PAEPO|nr:hypothetical protein [Paenibacillus polymyxa]MBE7897168.1 hypothetical protein [Paenibacillus polymyxa]MBG9763025.1 hypothetical protein [Paenibacillus polymyxa]MCC3257583.1 hypothetical protein [Paenibacillus polymyxa]QPK51334.1 hypothetical protein G7035_00390 [Paenibacillus polymyxa]QPK56424.1 hypothetical protein G7L40_00390 [Paenibacillus polymyxa]